MRAEPRTVLLHCFDHSRKPNERNAANRFEARCSEVSGRVSDQSIAPGALFAWLVDEGKPTAVARKRRDGAAIFDATDARGQDLSLARLAEGHVDALAILEEADCRAPDGARLGVWAAGPVDSLQAVSVGSGWRLDGIRRWCSGALDLTHALIRAEAGDGERVFLVSLELPGIRPVEGSWPAVGMAASSTFDVVFDRVELPPCNRMGSGVLSSAGGLLVRRRRRRGRVVGERKPWRPRLPKGQVSTLTGSLTWAGSARDSQASTRSFSPLPRQSTQGVVMPC